MHVAYHRRAGSIWLWGPVQQGRERCRVPFEHVESMLAFSIPSE